MQPAGERGDHRAHLESHLAGGACKKSISPWRPGSEDVMSTFCADLMEPKDMFIMRLHLSTFTRRDRFSFQKMESFYVLDKICQDGKRPGWVIFLPLYPDTVTFQGATW